MYEHPPKWTFIFISISIIGFIFQNVTDLWIFLAFIPIFALEAPWMFLTSIFLHSNFSHLLFNMFALFFFGMYLERIVGRQTFVIIFILSGIVGNLGHMITTPDPSIPAIGASGAVYGVMGALAVLVPFMLVFVYGMLPLPMVVVAILYAILDLVGIFSPSGIAHGAHLGGMFVGIVLALYLKIRMRADQIFLV